MANRALFICIIMLVLMAGCGKSKDDFEKGFKDSFQKSFVKSCTERGMKNGLKENDVTGRCDCIAKFLVTKYSSAELMKITATDSPESQRIFDEAIKTCK